ncbi:MAG: PhoU domain-containing protein [Nitrososphaerales archaeon]
MELRRAQEMGGGTLLESLPKDWVRKNNITRGSLLALEATPGGGLIIFPASESEKKPKEILLTYPAQYMRRLINLITGSYLLGFDIIKIVSRERIPYEDAQAMKKAIRQLVGLEIVEEDTKSITAQFLLETTALDPEKIFRRMHLITMGMLPDAVQALMQGDTLLKRSVSERDDEVDRLYFLLVRVVRTAAMDNKLAAKLKLSTIDCLDYRLSAYLLEAIGDTAEDIAKSSIVSIVNTLGSTEKEATSNILKILGMMQESAVRAFLSKNSEEGRHVVQLYEDVVEEIAKLESSIGSNENASAISRVSSSFSRIARYDVDIADLAYPMYPLVK